MNSLSSSHTPRLDTQTIPFSDDLRFVVTGNTTIIPENHHPVFYSETSLYPSVPPPPPLPRVRVSAPNILNETLNPDEPQCRKRSIADLNPIFRSDPNEFHVFHRQSKRQQYSDYDDNENDSFEYEEEEEEEEEDEDEDRKQDEGEEKWKRGEVSCSSSSFSFLKKNNKYYNKKKKTRKLSAIDMVSVKCLLETVLAQQQSFFINLLATLERNEQQRERIRVDKEEKWRAEERAHRRLLNNAMLLLTETLLHGNSRNGRNDKEVLVGQFDKANSDDGDEDEEEEEVEEKSENKKMKKKRSKNWKRGEVLQLIQLKGEMKQRVSNLSRRGFVWNELAEALASNGIRRDGKQCKEKWDKLMSSYKDVIDGKRDPAELSFFPELHSVVSCGNSGLGI